MPAPPARAISAADERRKGMRKAVLRQSQETSSVGIYMLSKELWLLDVDSLALTTDPTWRMMEAPPRSEKIEIPLFPLIGSL
jgi:hypothetical protein